MKVSKVEVDGKEYVVRNPSQKDIRKAKLESNKAFKRCLSSDEFFLRDELYSILRKRGFWNDQKEQELVDLRKDINEKELVLSKGGIELEEAKQVALELKLLRYKLYILTAKEREFDGFTVESQADDTYFNCLVSECVFDEEGNKIFSSYEDYLDKKNEEYAYKCAEKLSNLIFNFSDYEKELPENKFLIEYGFVDENLVLIEEQKEDEVQDEVEFKPFLKNGEPVQK